MSPFKPMLACNADLTKLRFPLLASPKFDGIRCVVLNGKALTRNLKPIPNAYTRAWLEKYCDGLDGELMVGDPTAKDCFQKTTSAVMSKDGEPKVTLYAFDHINAPDCARWFETRLELVEEAVQKAGDFLRLEKVSHCEVDSLEELNAYEAARVAEGWEGVMLRDPAGLYKHGRSTVREGGLLKVKRFADAEAVIVGFEERRRNDNPSTVNALGHLERSSHADNLKPLGDLGSLVVRPMDGYSAKFNIGTGFTAAQRVDLWARRNELLGQTVCFKFQAVGTDEAPRFPVFKGFRHEADR